MAPRKPSPHRKADPAPTTPDPIEIAMEAEASGTAPIGPAHDLLVSQNQLVRWQIAGERVALSLRALLVAGVLSTAAAFSVMVWSASQADGLVVEPFATPAALADRGLTGPVIAAEVLNQIARLDAQANNLQSISLSDSWSADSRVEIPQTGVSLDELDRLLRRRLGHETRIAGEVVLAKDGVALSARAGSGETVRATGAADDLPRLAAAAAEQLLEQARPGLYGRLLIFRGEPVERVEPILRRAIDESPTDAKRVEALMNLGGAYLINNRLMEALPLQREALRLSGPRPNPMVGNDLSGTERGLGRLEEALRLTRVSMGAKADSLTEVRANASAMNEAAMTGDFTKARLLVDPVGTRRLRGYLDTFVHRQIEAMIGQHETSAARARMPLLLQTAAWPARGARFQQALLITAAVADENWPALLDLTAPGAPESDLTLLYTPSPAPWRALGLANLGRIPEAQAIVAGLPQDCDRCLLVRGQVAELAGNRVGADQAYRQAARQAPSLPFARTQYAAVLLARGDLQGAIREGNAAVLINARFADAHEVLGEALLASGEIAGASARFAEAAKLAPRWGRLHLKWGEALAKLGKADAARAKWQAAAGMDLSPAERSRLQALIGRGA